MTRRDFVRIGAGAVAAGAAMKATLLEPSAALRPGRPRPPHSLRIVGTGIRGCDLLKAARQVPTGVCVGAADLYTTRHTPPKRPGARTFPPPATTAPSSTAKMWMRCSSPHPTICTAASLSTPWPRAKTFTAKSPCRTRWPMARPWLKRSGRQAHLPGRQPARQLHPLRQGPRDLRFRPARRGSLHRRAVESQLARRRLGLSHPARRQPADRRLGPLHPGRARRTLSTPSASSAGVSSPTTAPAWAAICSSTCSPAFQASPASTRAHPRLLQRRPLPLQRRPRVSRLPRNHLRLSVTQWRHPGPRPLQPEQQRRGRAHQLLRVHRNSGGYRQLVTFTPQNVAPRFESYGWNGMTDAQREAGHG
jgi:hypothetical protein